MDYELYGHIIGTYRMSGERGGGRWGEEGGKWGRGEKCKEAKAK